MLQECDNIMMEGQNSGRPAQMMSFNDAVTNCLINNYMNFSGRASKSEYWWFLLFSFIIGFIAGLIDYFAFGVQVGFATLIMLIVIALPSIALTVRRIHDFGQSGWLFLFTIIPYIGSIIILIFGIMEGEEYPNQYGEVPTNIIKKNTNIYDNY